MQITAYESLGLTANPRLALGSSTLPIARDGANGAFDNESVIRLYAW